jgi:hypothetical protein
MIAEVERDRGNSEANVLGRRAPVLVLDPAIGRPWSPVSSSVCHAAK